MSFAGGAAGSGSASANPFCGEATLDGTGGHRLADAPLPAPPTTPPGTPSAPPASRKSPFAKSGFAAAQLSLDDIVKEGTLSKRSHGRSRRWAGRHFVLQPGYLKVDGHLNHSLP
jgi:hypothetical protein